MDMKKALDLWVEITGVNPQERTIQLKDMDIHFANQVLERSLHYDKTHVTTNMLMSMYLDEFLENRHLSMKDIINNYILFQNELEKISKLKSLLESDEMLENKKEFQESMAQALSHYGVNPSVFETMVKNESHLAELRYSAFHATNQLEVVQFAHGVPSNKKPKLFEDVYAFRDINTLIKWMMGVESGVVVAMIQDVEQPSSSYFVFAIRNGGTLSIVTDREKTAHPLQSKLSRSRARGREFYNRITNYHFPYSILEIDFGDNDRAYMSSTTNELAKREDGVAIKKIKDLEDNEVVWLIMMISLLEEKFFLENYQTKELAYTPQMMAETDFMIEEAKKNNVAVLSYPTIEIPTLTTESMQTDKMQDVFGYEPTGQHDWMIERYSVPEDVFQVIDNQESKLLLPNGPSKFNETIELELKTMDASNFDSLERMKKDRIYLARYNQAQVINQKAKNEFEERKNEVINWYFEAIQRNLPNLLEAVVKKEFFASKDPDMARTRRAGWETTNTGGNFLRVGLLKDEGYDGWTHCHVKGKSSEMSKVTCAVNDSTATLVGHFYPRTANQLADLCGCDVNELHELLQNWKIEERHTGNHILDSVDPMDWSIHDPWEKLRMDVKIYLSKKTYNQLCKSHQTGNQSFWLQSNEE